MYSVSSLAARPWTAQPGPWQIEGTEARHACSSMVALLVRACWGKAVFSWSGWVGVKRDLPGQDGLGSESAIASFARGRGVVETCPIFARAGLGFVRMGCGEMAPSGQDGLGFQSGAIAAFA